jgi:hypothetical protein
MPQRVIANDNVLFHQFDNEAVILNLADETYYRLDPVALDMWMALTTQNSVDEAAHQILAAYDTSYDVVIQDIQEFIARLVERKLVRVETT